MSEHDDLRAVRWEVLSHTDSQGIDDIYATNGIVALDRRGIEAALERLEAAERLRTLVQDGIDTIEGAPQYMGEWLDLLRAALAQEEKP